jgi:hypothetical protein
LFLTFHITLVMPKVGCTTQLLVGKEVNQQPKDYTTFPEY